jgi:hypothetical protein
MGYHCRKTKGLIVYFWQQCGIEYNIGRVAASGRRTG